ncbi:GNAT family N-acetyltransferase [Mucilaginibacter gynuensis]|uniref:GNAT family N-acetyltransferase n=1 Tax=Mucilaginibacter gynuensis TaxID=1302236 RepID=A0ABP8GTN4_9SPHI
MIFTGTNFILRRWQTDDAVALQKHADNPNISGCLLDRFPYPYSLTDAVTFIGLKKDETPITNFPIVVDGEVAGVIGLDFRQDVYRKTPLLGYWLAEQHWGKGIMPEAVKLITGYAFQNLDIINILAFVLGGNPKSMRVLEKAGYKKQGVINQSVIKNNVVMDEHVYAGR